MANVILLNGCSSSGKTTLAEMLQQLLPEPYQYVGLDQFRDGMPARVRGLNAPEGSEGARGLNVVPGRLQGAPVTEIHLGDFGESVMAGMRRSVAGLAANGVPVIVDDLLFKRSYLEDYAALLDPLTSWFVGVHCDLDVVNERELARVGRFPGTATAHYELVHSHGEVYDVEVDSSTTPPRAMAEQVIARLATPPEALLALQAG